MLVAATSLGNNLIGKLVTRQLVMQALKSIGVRVTTRTAARFVPILGQALAASISFGAMKLLGNAHVEDCYKVARQALLARVESAPTDGVRVIEVTAEMVELAHPERDVTPDATLRS